MELERYSVGRREPLEKQILTMMSIRIFLGAFSRRMFLGPTTKYELDSQWWSQGIGIFAGKKLLKGSPCAIVVKNHCMQGSNYWEVFLLLK